MSDKVSTKITFENEVYTVKDPNAINKYEDSADSKEKRGKSFSFKRAIISLLGRYALSAKILSSRFIIW